MQWLPEGWIPKAIAVDIDGTITDNNKKIHLGAIESLRRLEDAGIPIILATGNVRAITYGLWRFIGASGPMVCENGGVVWHPEWDGPVVRADGKRAKDARVGFPSSVVASGDITKPEQAPRANDRRSVYVVILRLFITVFIPNIHSGVGVASESII